MGDMAPAARMVVFLYMDVMRNCEMIHAFGSYSVRCISIFFPLNYVTATGEYGYVQQEIL